MWHLIRDMKKRQRSVTAALVLLVGGGLATFAAVEPARAVDILPHQAVYDMKLGRTTSDSGVSSVQGTLMLTWEDGCGEWLISQRLFLKISRDDVSFTTTSAFDTRESKDGLNFSYEDTTIREPGGPEYAQGSARLIAPGSEGSLVIEAPEAGQYILPEGAMFPTAQMVDVLVRAEAGERIMSHLVYDGTDGATLFDVATVIADPSLEAVEDAAGGEVMVWPMRFAYYEYNTTDSLPQVEIGADVQANGIAREISFDYGNFMVESTLISIEGLPEADCPEP